jgi:hypothetical protein
MNYLSRPNSNYPSATKNFGKLTSLCPIKGSRFP